MAEFAEPIDEAPSRWPALAGLRATLGRPPVWGLVTAIELLLALAPALIYHAWLSSALEHRYEPGTTASLLDATFRFDQREGLGAASRAMGVGGAVLAAFAMLVGCFCAGGWLQVFLERTRGESLRRFFHGGARYFWRFFRLLLLTLVLAAGLYWITTGWPWNRLVLQGLMGVPARDVGALETLADESTVFALRRTQEALHLASLGLLFAWGDYTRTRLALHDTSSVVWAGLCTVWTIVRHPVKTLRPLLGLFLAELAVVVVLGWFAHSVELDVVRGPSAVGVLVLVATATVALAWRVVTRGARYHAAVRVSREIVVPIARPDPWKESVGGPGGPRYPIGGDEYSVSM